MPSLILESLPACPSKLDAQVGSALDSIAGRKEAPSQDLLFKPLTAIIMLLVASLATFVGVRKYVKANEELYSYAALEEI